jgi:hypothetical protein
MSYPINRRAALAGLSAAVLAACTTPPPAPLFPELTFTHLPPLRLDAAALDIVDAYKPPLTAPNVEHRMPVSPAGAARRWAKDRLVPAGAAGRIVVTIEDAAVTETALERTRGVRGAVTTDQSERYDARLFVRIAIANPRGTGEVTAEAQRSRTVPENLSLNERDQVLFEITEALIGNLNTELENAIDSILPQFRLEGRG